MFTTPTLEFEPNKIRTDDEQKSLSYLYHRLFNQVFMPEREEVQAHAARTGQCLDAMKIKTHYLSNRIKYR